MPGLRPLAMPAAGIPYMSKRLIASYVLDWIIIIAIAALGAGLWKVTPNHRPFTLTDPSISFPYVEHEKISTSVLFVVSIIAPLIITFVVAIILPPRDATLNSATRKSLIWRRKLWEWHTAWLGLCLSFALSFFFVQAMKNLFGRPRPDLLSRCNPDWEHQADYALGGYPQVLNGFYLVSSTICRQKDKSKLNDGFSSFPSGHATYAWAGMLYLALNLSSKFGVSIPYLSPFAHATQAPPPDPRTENGRTIQRGSSPLAPSPLRSEAAAPPLILLLLPLIPICVAIYIASTRFSDFRHHPFDIIAGSLLGIGFAFFSFRLYHLPLRRAGGGSWRSRAPERAFGFGEERKKSNDLIQGDVETGNVRREGQNGVERKQDDDSLMGDLGPGVMGRQRQNGTVEGSSSARA